MTRHFKWKRREVLVSVIKIAVTSPPLVFSFSIPYRWRWVYNGNIGRIFFLVEQLLKSIFYWKPSFVHSKKFPVSNILPYVWVEILDIILLHCSVYWTFLIWNFDNVHCIEGVNLNKCRLFHYISLLYSTFLHILGSGCPLGTIEK